MSESISKRSSDELLGANDEYSELIHPTINPNLSLPEHLQSQSFEEDLWQRMNASRFKSPSLKLQTLKENAEKRDLLRSAIAAASEREKEILMHNQARYFTSILYGFSKSFGNFLNTPIAPNSWLNQNERIVSEVSPDPGKGNEDDENGDKTGDSGKGGKDEGEGSTNDKAGNPLREIVLYLLTPKVFLTIIALGFGVAAGYSQLQIRNLNDTIKTYEGTLNSLKANNEALDSRIEDFDDLKDSLNLKLEKVNKQLTEVEKENIKLTTDLASTKQLNEQYQLQLNQARVDLNEAKTGTQSSAADLQAKIDSLNIELGESKASIAKFKTKAEQWESAYKSQEKAKTSLSKEADRLRSDQLETKTDLARKEAELSEARVKAGVLSFAERALKDIRNLAQKYSTIKDEHVLYHIDRYESRKERQNRI